MRAGRPEILIIDNDEDILRILDMKLASNGYDCTTAINGSQGLARLTPNVQLVISDLNMPGGGAGFIKSIRSASEAAIIVMSAFPDHYADQLRFIHRLAWVSKPINSQSLLDVMEMQLSLRTGPKSFVKSARACLSPPAL